MSELVEVEELIGWTFDGPTSHEPWRDTEGNPRRRAEVDDLLGFLRSQGINCGDWAPLDRGGIELALYQQIDPWGVFVDDSMRDALAQAVAAAVREVAEDE